VLAATLFSLPLLGSDDRGVMATLTPDLSLAIFVIAMAGWMPMPTNGAILYSKWVCERQKVDRDQFDYGRALSDFRIGYGLTLVLALCFVLMGTAVLFETGRQVPATAAGFATELFGVFTTVIGTWSYPIIAAAGIAVIWSTQVALMDAGSAGRWRIDHAAVPDEQFQIIHLLRNQHGIDCGTGNRVLQLSCDIFERCSRRVSWNWAGIIILAAFAVAFLWNSIS
jgi:Mn2+/Fe2+ NRAMP family transporter